MSMCKEASSEREALWKDRGELSLPDIQRRSREYWQRILRNHEELTSLSRSFQRQKTLGSDQCCSIRNAIRDLQHSTKGLQRFLERSRFFPLHICSARFSLFKALYRMDIQLGELSILLKMYSVTNRTSLREMILLSQDIRQRLNEVQRSWKSMQRGIQVFWGKSMRQVQKRVRTEICGNGRFHTAEEDLMSDPFDDLSFEREIDPKNWTGEQILHALTFEARFQADGTLFLSGAALREGFSLEQVRELTGFLSERVTLPPKEPVYDFHDFVPQSVVLEEQQLVAPAKTELTSTELGALVEYLGMVRGATEIPMIVRLLDKLEMMQEETFRRFGTVDE